MLDQQGLLAELDAFTTFIDQRGVNGFQLTPGGVPAPADLAAWAATVGLPAQAASAPATLLLTLGLAVGVLRASDLQVHVGPLHAAWTRRDDSLRAGIIYAAWCHRVDWSRVLGDEGPAARLQTARDWMLRRLHDLPALVDVNIPDLARMVAEHTSLPQDHQTIRYMAAAFLDPLVGLTVANVHPPAPAPPKWLRLTTDASRVIASALIASALIAGGDEVPLTEEPNLN